MLPLALSTMWIQHRFDRLVPFCEAGERMGFQAFELNHMLPSRYFADFDPGAYRIVAVHAPCPRPRSSRGHLSALEEEKRRSAVEAAKTTMNTAVRFGANAVVIHSGRVDGIHRHERRLRELYIQGRYGTSSYLNAKERLVEARAEQAPAHLAATKRSLAEVVAHAKKHGVQVGLENRVGYHEVPSFEEMKELLDELPANAAGFWYDTGHARVLDNLGFEPYLRWLKLFALRTVGIHFHDAAGLRDHLLPGMADIDFSAIAAHIPDDAVRTCEFDWQFSLVGVKWGVEQLQRAGCAP